MIKTNFLGNDVPKENMHYTCIACITIDSVLKIDKKNHPQVYLEECKYRVKKIQMSRFINKIQMSRFINKIQMSRSINKIQMSRFINKIQMSRFINTELILDSSDSDLDSEKAGAKFNNKLMEKLEKSGCDSD